MKRIHLFGFAVVAVLALCAVIGAPAYAALPELVKAGTTEKAGGEITGKSSGSTKLESKGGTTVTCTSATSSKGKAINTKETEGTIVKFKGCTESIFKSECKTTGAGSGEIVTNALTGIIGYVTGSSKTEVGLELKPTGTTEPALEGVFTTFTCLGGFVGATVKGAVIGKLTGPFNSSTTSLGLEYVKGSTAGSQKVTSIEGGFMTEAKLESKLSSGSYEASNQQGSGSVEFAEKVELKK